MNSRVVAEIVVMALVIAVIACTGSLITAIVNRHDRNYYLKRCNTMTTQLLEIRAKNVEIVDNHNKLLLQRDNIAKKYKELVTDLVKVPEARKTLLKHGITIRRRDENKVSPQRRKESNISK